MLILDYGRLQFNCIKIALFGYLQIYRPPHGGFPIEDGYLLEVRRTCVNAANDIALLVKLHMHYYDRFMPTVICLSAMIAIFTLFEDLNTAVSRANCIEMVKVLMLASDIFPAARGMMRMIGPTAEILDLDLPLEIRKTIDDFDRTRWAQGDEKRFKSILPNFALRREMGPTDHYMGELLQNWEKFGVGSRN